MRARPPRPNGLHDDPDVDVDERVLRRRRCMRDVTGDYRRDEYPHAFLADVEWLSDGHQEECG